MKTIYIKLTNDCNLHCEHCYVGNKKSVTMSPEVLNAILEELNTMYKNGEKFEVIFHGGEPMISLRHRDLRAIKTMNTLNIPVTMTTNLVYTLNEYTNRVIKCMKPNSSSRPFICTSWDKGIRFNTKDRLQMWEDNVKTLFENGVDIQVIVTVTSLLVTTPPDELFMYFKKLGFDKLNFERITASGNAKKNNYLIPKNITMRKWLYEAYKLNNEKYHFSIPLFENLKWAKEGVYNGCRARQCSKNVITFNPDGSVATCPNIYEEHVRYMGRPSSITEAAEILSGDTVYKSICQREATRHNECYTCKYFKICNGDCFQLSWDEECPGLKEIMEEI